MDHSGVNSGVTTMAVDHCLKRLQAGDKSALDELAARSYDRVRLIAQRQLRRFPGLIRFVETQDVLHDALAKLHQRLQQRQPENAREFFRWTSRQIRDHLVDLLRHFYGRRSSREGSPHGGRAGQVASLDAISDEGFHPHSDTYDAAKVQELAEFHEAASGLPEELREVFDLIFYHGLTQEQAAEIVGVSDRTIRTRWQKARRALAPYMSQDEADQEV